MLIIALKPSHDGSIAVIKDRRLILSIEAEKDSNIRYGPLTANTYLELAQHLDAAPDVVCLGGWHKDGPVGRKEVGSGYAGIEEGVWSDTRFFGHRVKAFSSSHERSHIMMAVGMAPPSQSDLLSVLVWEGLTGAFYVVDRRGGIKRRIPVLEEPGARYAFLYALADPRFPDHGQPTRLGDSGKLMALAAYGRPDEADTEVQRTVEEILTYDGFRPAPKFKMVDSVIYNAGVESEVTKTAAALLTQRLFEKFAEAAVKELPPGSPLLISGGCGLNCDWNSQWIDLDHFESVFVPPCANDSGSAIGTAIDALGAVTGDPQIEWDVYSGLEFVEDAVPDSKEWEELALDLGKLTREISDGKIVAWVQGRWEIGPRALGNRSLLAEPFHVQTRDRLNGLKQRESYRPIAPVCRVEDIPLAFEETFEDPYMLYFRHVRADAAIDAVTHVDGSARAQTVRATQNLRLHELLTEVSRQTGIGILCNTSLNFSGYGFINRMSDLDKFSRDNGVDSMVVGERWYRRIQNVPEM